MSRVGGKLARPLHPRRADQYTHVPKVSFVRVAPRSGQQFLE